MAGRLAYAGKTDVGLKRTNNEDNFIMVPGHGLFVLADGMGGHASGQVASAMCVSNIAKFICEISHQPGFEMTFKNPAVSFEANMLINAIKFANERVYIQSCKERSMEGMGTTVTAILNAPHGLILAHVGDSRIYRVRKGQIVQMSRDHSLLNHLLDTGELKPEDAATFSKKNMIFRAIGLKENVDVDVKEVPREKGDIYMMCSDGLSDIVSDAQICQAITNAPNLTEASNALIGLALKAGGKDNVTVVCVGVEDDGAQSQPAQAVSRPGVQNAQPGPRNISQPMLVSAPPQRVPQGGPQAPGNYPPGGPVPVNVRAVSPQMVGRPPSYPMNGAVPAAGAMYPGMVPMPARAGGMPSMPAAVPVQPQMPTRMHSVREIVERITVPKVMPKPVGSAGRPSAANMPAIPGAGKPRKAETADPSGSYSFGDASGEEMDLQRPTVLDNPIILSDFFKSKEERENSDNEGTPEKRELRRVNAQGQENVNADLPETNLLFTEPPMGAAKPERVPEQATPSFDDEDDDDDDDKTVIRPYIPSELFAEGASTGRPMPAAVAMSEAVTNASASLPPGSKPVLISSADELSKEFSSERASEPVKAHPAPKKGYVPPENVVLPPHHDYDEDDDNIEIAGFDDDDNYVTRTYKKPDFTKW
ncbi:MAG: Stp1/IreP family PP2C-type Ser/Thr phosphatase [Proteobacteria bacterium]|nr:Stp1/IreP family PP2C-type Ser/Thr phosphatase [Pseudomonadota bacterium]